MDKFPISWSAAVTKRLPSRSQVLSTVWMEKGGSQVGGGFCRTTRPLSAQWILSLFLSLLLLSSQPPTLFLAFSIFLWPSSVALLHTSSRFPLRPSSDILPSSHGQMHIHARIHASHYLRLHVATCYRTKNRQRVNGFCNRSAHARPSWLIREMSRADSRVCGEVTFLLSAGQSNQLF